MFMKRGLPLMLSLFLLVCAFGCAAPAPQGTETAPAPAAPAGAKVTLTDGNKTVIIETAGGKTAAELLDEAGIVLASGDVLSVDPSSVLAGDVTLAVLRRAEVIVVLAGAEPLADEMTRVVLVGGTVADAIEAAGLTLTDTMEVNQDLEDPLESGMEIIVTDKAMTTATAAETTAAAEETTPAETEETTPETAPATRPAETKPAQTTKATTTTTAKATEKATTSTAKVTEPATTTTTTTTKATEPANNDPHAVATRTKVYDCDGSGSGIELIFYVDGTVESRAFEGE